MRRRGLAWWVDQAKWVDRAWWVDRLGRPMIVHLPYRGGMRLNIGECRGRMSTQTWPANWAIWRAERTPDCRETSPPFRKRISVGMPEIEKRLATV